MYFALLDVFATQVSCLTHVCLLSDADRARASAGRPHSRGPLDWELQLPHSRLTEKVVVSGLFEKIDFHMHVKTKG